MLKRLFSLISCIIIMLQCFFCIPMEAIAGENFQDEIVEFECGLDMTAYFDKSTGTLTIKGSGDMNFFYDSVPWWAYRNDITAVVIEEGITSIADIAFLDCNITEIKIPASVEKIGTDAFSMTYLETIEVAENSKLMQFPVTDYLRKIPWYKKQVQGPVYLGRMLLDYKITMPAKTTITVLDGTYSINKYAFKDQTNLVNIIVPDSVERIGYGAFENTAWFDEQPYHEPIYLGKVLYYYNYPWGSIKSSDIKDEFVIPEGIVSISQEAFSSRCIFKKITLSESIEYIGYGAFYNSKYLEEIVVPQNNALNHIEDVAFCNADSLKEFDFPEGLETIGINSFLGCDSLKNVYLPSTIEKIGVTAFNPSELDSFVVDVDNPYFCTDENGILYSKDQTAVYASFQKTAIEELVLPDTITDIRAQAFVASPIKSFVLPESVTVIAFEAFADSAVASINIPYGVKRIDDYVFSNCDKLKEIEIPKSVEFIDTMAFESCGILKKIVIPSEVNYIAGDVFDGCSLLNIYCYKDSPAYYYATENDIPYVVLVYPDTSELDLLLDDYNHLDRDKYIPETLAFVDEAVAAIDMTITVITQEMVDNWASDIKAALDKLEYYPADYSEIDSVKSTAALIDRSLYTDESLTALDEAVAAVDESLDVSNQHMVSEYASAIREALYALEYLPANYEKVEAAIAQSEKLDRIIYSQATLAVLDQSISAVDYTLNITQQSIVDGFAERINSAISALEYAVVVLNNEPNGIIVSATAKEIYPETVLTVDVLDSTEIESTDFAFGGHIKSLNYYDINLFLGGEKIQPDGTVTVKIRVPEGADPKKCRVYHVSDDPVDPLVRFASTLDGNFVVFETDHFSEFAVIEVESYLNGVSVTKLPSKLEYSLGEKIDLTGLELTAVMSDGNSQVITDYDVTSVDTSSVGTKTVTVYYTEGDITKSASFEITVSADKITASITSNGESVTEINKKVKWYRSYSKDAVQLACGVSASGSYNVKWSSDNSKITVDSNGKVSCKGFLFAQKATITATVTDSAGNIIATDTVVIRFYKFNFQLSKIQAMVYEIVDLRKFLGYN